MSVLGRVLERVRPDPPEVTYELQQMTHRGGWRRELGPVDDPEELPDRGAMWGKSGRYRVLKREDGDFAEVIWTWESDDSIDYYDRRKQMEALRGEVEKLRAEMEQNRSG